MMQSKNVGNCVEEMLIMEPNELGWEVVYKEGTLYRKKTIEHTNGISRIYMPIPFKKKQ